MSELFWLDGKNLTVPAISRIVRGDMRGEVSAGNRRRIGKPRSMILDMFQAPGLSSGFSRRPSRKKDGTISPAAMETFNRTVIHFHSAAIESETCDKGTRAILPVKANSPLSDGTGKTNLSHCYRDSLLSRLPSFVSRRKTSGIPNPVAMNKGKLLFQDGHMPVKALLSLAGLRPLQVRSNDTFVTTNSDTGDRPDTVLFHGCRDRFCRRIRPGNRIRHCKTDFQGRHMSAYPNRISPDCGLSRMRAAGRVTCLLRQTVFHSAVDARMLTTFTSNAWRFFL